MAWTHPRKVVIEAHSRVRPHDASRRNAGELLYAAILGRQHVAIRSGRAARDATLMLVPGIMGGGVPWPVVGHRALDREHAAIIIGDDQVEWLRGIGLGHEVIIESESSAAHTTTLVARWTYVPGECSALIPPRSERRMPRRRQPVDKKAARQTGQPKFGREYQRSTASDHRTL